VGGGGVGGGARARARARACVCAAGWRTECPQPQPVRSGASLPEPIQVAAPYEEQAGVGCPPSRWTESRPGGPQLLKPLGPAVQRAGRRTEPPLYPVGCGTRVRPVSRARGPVGEQSWEGVGEGAREAGPIPPPLLLWTCVALRWRLGTVWCWRLVLVVVGGKGGAWDIKPQ
jgi:hypothetical protein